MTGAGDRVTLRAARPGDGPDIARVFVDSWRDTYPGVLPDRVLVRLDAADLGRRWDQLLRRLASMRTLKVTLAEIDGAVAGYTYGGPNRDRALPFDAELYELYVHPEATGGGCGADLLARAFEQLAAAGARSAIIWALAKNPARFFYERMGGKIVAQRSERRWGANLEEIAFGWTRLPLTPAMRPRGEIRQP